MQFFSPFSCIFHNLIVPLQPIISPMRIRLHNARILTMSPKDDNIFMGEIVVEDGRIIAIGTDSITGQYDKEIDCHANLLMPGFKNAHAHSGMSGLRSLADDLPLNEWLTKSIFPVEALMTADDIYWMSQLSVLEYLTSGITACLPAVLPPVLICIWNRRLLLKLWTIWDSVVSRPVEPTISPRTFVR